MSDLELGEFTFSGAQPTRFEGATQQVPKLRVPLQMGIGGFRTVEQDSDEEVAQCVYAVLATPVNSRLEEPDFGIEDPTFETFPLDLSGWDQAVAEWEPRASMADSQEILAGAVSVREEVAS